MDWALRNSHRASEKIRIWWSATIQKICQSCGMPLQSKEDFGSNADGSKSGEYCAHCYQSGKFLDEGVTLQQKIDKNVKFAVQMGMSKDEAKKMASNVLPKLKRWKKQSGKI